jgi:hypothetical protein
MRYEWVDRNPIKLVCQGAKREMPKALEQEVPSIEDLKGVVEKLRDELAAVRKAAQAEPKEKQ